MSLTKQDLTAIGNLIDTGLESKLEEKLESKFEEKLEPIRKDIKSLKKGQTKLQKGQKQIKQDINMVIDSFDHQLIHHNKIINRIENHIELPPLPKTC